MLFCPPTCADSYPSTPQRGHKSLYKAVCVSCPGTLHLGAARNVTCKSLSYGFKPPRSPGPAGRMFLTYTPFSSKPSETLNPKSSPAESLYKVTCGDDVTWWEEKKNKPKQFVRICTSIRWAFFLEWFWWWVFCILERSLTSYLVLTVLELSLFLHYINILRSHLIFQ